MTNFTVDEYIYQLEKILEVLPKKDRDNHIMEVRDHFLQSINDGSPEENVLKNFLSPEELGTQIIAEYNKLYGDSSKEKSQFKQKK